MITRSRFGTIVFWIASEIVLLILFLSTAFLATFFETTIAALNGPWVLLNFKTKDPLSILFAKFVGFLLESISRFFFASIYFATVSFFLPFALRLLRTARPSVVRIRNRNPCVFALFLFLG